MDKNPLYVARYYFNALMGIPEGEGSDHLEMGALVASLFSIAESLNVLAEDARNRIHR